MGNNEKWDKREIYNFLHNIEYYSKKQIASIIKDYISAELLADVLIKWARKLSNIRTISMLFDDIDDE